jgi:hypothetical protein
MGSRREGYRKPCGCRNSIPIGPHRIMSQSGGRVAISSAAHASNFKLNMASSSATVTCFPLSIAMFQSLRSQSAWHTAPMGYALSMSPFTRPCSVSNRRSMRSSSTARHRVTSARWLLTAFLAAVEVDEMDVQLPLLDWISVWGENHLSGGACPSLIPPLARASPPAAPR